jgi:hypothetical protein
MNNLRAQVEIAETGEIVTVEADSVAEILYKIREAIGDYVHVTIRTLAVLAVVLSVLSYPTHAEDITTAGQTSAPLCSGVDCIGGSR